MIVKNNLYKWPAPILPIVTLTLISITCLTGCAQPLSKEAEARLATRAKLKNGMTVEQINQVLGSPTEFRKGNGQRDDVAMYRIGKETFTLYFYHNSLTRVVSSHNPVNR